MDVVSLTRQLLSFNTVNPPGNEEVPARFTGELLSGHGFRTEYYKFGENRLHLVAEKGLNSRIPPVVLSGHFDTVPLGAREWSIDPFKGIVKDGKLWGRGSSDMKGGVAAMIIAAVESFGENPPAGGVRLIFTAAEELGCTGVLQLESVIKDRGEASAIIVGEPTSNFPYIGHKGALYLNAVSKGRTAHSSMPGLGDNAIYKAAMSILKARDFIFNAEKDDLLGYPTINVGRMTGGMNLNSVPDHAEFSIDIRSTSRVNHENLIARLASEFGQDSVIEVLVDMKPVYTDPSLPFVKLVFDICGLNREDKTHVRALPYLTDGSVLQRMYNGAPTIILGPGEPQSAHQTDEFCYINKLEESVRIYKEILAKWKRLT